MGTGVALGRWGALLRGQFYGLTGLGDRTLVAFYTTPDFEEQRTFQFIELTEHVDSSSGAAECDLATDTRSNRDSRSDLYLLIA